jgi:hypothetical protein
MIEVNVALVQFAQAYFEFCQKVIRRVVLPGILGRQVDSASVHTFERFTHGTLRILSAVPLAGVVVVYAKFICPLKQRQRFVSVHTFAAHWQSHGTKPKRGYIDARFAESSMLHPEESSIRHGRFVSISVMFTLAINFVSACVKYRENMPVKCAGAAGGA